MGLPAILELVEEYKKILNSFHLEPVRHSREAISTSKESALAHCFWMLGEIEGFLQKEDIEYTKKAHRWIGFIQGVFWSHQVFSIEHMMSDNKKL